MGILLLLSFLPPLIYVFWIRNTEKYNREKWRTIFLCFLWGSTIAIIASLILELFLVDYFALSFKQMGLLNISTAVIVAPFAEELTKPLILSSNSIKKELDELEDGLIYGAVAGLGFSATENLFYGYDFLSKGIVVFLILMAARSFGACLLHASATAWTGYGYGKIVMNKTSLIRVLPYFVLAIFIHSFYNFLLSYEFIGAFIGLFAALLFAGYTIKIVRGKIIKLDLKKT
ncbi:MAG: PrsW family intramembrane metalloprotease [Candidatus Thermoplasmatota archaeon]